MEVPKKKMEIIMVMDGHLHLHLHLHLRRNADDNGDE